MGDFLSGCVERLVVSKSLHGSINDVVLSPDGRFLAWIDDRSNVTVWDLVGNKVRLFDFEEFRPSSVWGNLSFSFDGRFLAWGTRFGSVAVLDLYRGRVNGFDICDGGVFSVSWSPRNMFLASVCRGEGRVYVLDFSTGDVWRLRPGCCVSVSWDPSGRYLAGGSKCGFVVVWDSQFGGAARIFRSRGHHIWDIFWDPLGRFVGGIVFYSEFEEAQIRLRRGEIDEEEASFLDHDPEEDWFFEFFDVSSGSSVAKVKHDTEVIEGFAWDPLGRYFAISGNYTIEVYDVKNWKLMVELDEFNKFYWDTVKMLGIEERYRACLGGREFNEEDFDDYVSNFAFDPKILSVVWSPSGRFLISGSSWGGFWGNLVFWDTKTWDVYKAFLDLPCEVRKILLSGDGRSLVIVCGSRIFLLSFDNWRFYKLFHVFDFSSAVYLDWLFDGSLLTVFAGGAFATWDSTNWTISNVIVSRRSGVSSASLSSSGRFLSVAYRRHVEIWDTDNWIIFREFGDSSPFPTFYLNDVSWGKSDHFLVVCGSFEKGECFVNGKIVVWDVLNGEQVMDVLDSQVREFRKILWDRSGRYFACMGYTTWWRGNKIVVWDFHRGEKVGEFMADKNNELKSFSWCSNNNVALAFKDGRVVVWNFLNNEKVEGFLSNVGTIYAIKCSPDGNYIAIDGSDELSIWDLSKNTKIIGFKRDYLGDICYVSWHPKYPRLAISGKKRLLIFDINYLYDLKEIPNQGICLRPLIWNHKNESLMIGASRDSVIKINLIDGSMKALTIPSHIYDCINLNFRRYK